MRNSISFPVDRRGFTLLEILVALVLIGLLAGVLVPGTLSQLRKGETNRLVEDLNSVANMSRTFRTDVFRWPGDLEDLYSQPTPNSSTDDKDVGGNAYPAGLAARWAGPYSETGTIKGDTLATGLGGVVMKDFGVVAWNSKDYFTVRVKNVSEDDAKAISVLVDGDDVVTETGDLGGRVRWKAADATAGTPDMLLYLVAPAQ